jgi:hypothetical protein
VSYEAKSSRVKISDHPAGWSREGFSAMKVSKRNWGAIRLMLTLREYIDLELTRFACVAEKRLRQSKLGNPLFPD